MRDRGYSVRRIFAAAALALVLPCLAFAQTPISPLPGEMPAQCSVPRALYVDDTTLPKAAKKLAHGKLTIVALGSSSTLGVGASSSAAAWPARLEAELRRRLPQADITVANRGKLRDPAVAMVKRMAADALAAKPDLVIWETGTAEAVRNMGAEHFAAALEEGAERILAADAELVLMTPQFSRETARLIGYQPYIEVMGNLSVRADVLIFPRYDVMRHLVESNQLQLEGLSPAQAAATADRVYDCIARQVARVLLRAMAMAPR
ncbi:MAG: SGNH/GDSL hydrolase family protein [Telmatospirillum sp.]|nr:SGNH/GDSL hydrolase family protein [Telmatospirillum sp.]